MKNYKLFLGSIGLCVLGAGMVMGDNPVVEGKEIVHICQQQNVTDSVVTVSGDAVVSGSAVTTGASVVSQSAFVVDQISYKITGDTTVAATRIENGYSKSTLNIPEQVTYQQQTYTVTSVEMKQLKQCYETVKKIVVPKTVTGNVIIKRRYLSEYAKLFDAGVQAYNIDEDIESEEEMKEYGLSKPFKVEYQEELLGSYSKKKLKQLKRDQDLILCLQAFPNLSKVKFLGNTAPEKIQIEQYVSDKNAYYEVPAGKKKSYQAVTKKITLHRWKSWLPSDEANSYKSQNIAPDVIESGEKNPERTIFSTSKGVYWVKKSGKSGKGKVALLELKKAKRIYKAGKVIENTLDTKIKNGNYTYTLTELESGSVKWTNVDNSTIIVTIPDTITKLQESCLDPKVPYLFLPRNCKVIGDDLFQDQSDIEWNAYVCYAPGVKNLKMVFFNKVIYSNRSKSLKVNGINKKIRVKKAVKGASIKAPKKITVKAGGTKTIHASFGKKTNETLCYEMVDTNRYYNLSASNLAKKVTVSQSGKITAKKAGTYYCMVYSRESGKHKIVKVVVNK